MTASGTPQFVLLAALAVAASATATQAATSKAYSIRYLEPSDAVALLYVRVPEALECTVRSERSTDRSSAGQRGVITVKCERDDIGAKTGEALAAIDVPRPTRRFHVTVLEASRKDGTTPDLPPSEKKALADAKKVMTYRSFQIDAETVLESSDRAETQMSGRYRMTLSMESSKSGDTSVEVSQFRLYIAQAGPTPDAAGIWGLLFDTSFSLRVGETIVLGTSAAGDAARMVLVTVLP
jgi:hypothetical protein